MTDSTLLHKLDLGEEMTEEQRLALLRGNREAPLLRAILQQIRDWAAEAPLRAASLAAEGSANASHLALGAHQELVALALNLYAQAHDPAALEERQARPDDDDGE